MYRYGAPEAPGQCLQKLLENNSPSTVTIDLNILNTISLLDFKAFLAENELFTQAQFVKDFIDKKKGE